MSNFINGLKSRTNYTYTENGAVTHKSTGSSLYDMFALGAAMRTRSDEDVIVMFQKAYDENPTYALKCLFYLRDILEGQGERRFFKVCMRWLATQHPESVSRNLAHIPEFGRWDDLYALVKTPAEKEVFNFMYHQLALDVESKTPSLLAKWLKSENTSSKESRLLAKITRNYFNMTAKQYRKTLSILRKRINVLERLMSENRWDEIEFDKIPSKAGMIYKNAFARHDIERAKSEKNVQTYEEFAKDSTTTVNAKALYPYECVKQAIKTMFGSYGYWSQPRVAMDDTNRLMINKYWDNLTDYFKGATLNAIPVVDTSGSMTGSWKSTVAPIDVAISLGLYCAERNSGPFKNHYVSFASRPQLIETNGVDFCDKVARIYRTNLCDNTNIEATFDLLLEIIEHYDLSDDEVPENVVIISDMEFDEARGGWSRYGYSNPTPKETLIEGIKAKWNRHGVKMPNLIFWNVDARQDNIPMKSEHGITFVSGFSPVIFEMIMSGKTAEDLMMDKLNSQRYACIA